MSDKFEGLYELAQQNKDAPFRAFVFDLKDSKKMDSISRIVEESAMCRTLEDMKNYFLQMEKTTNKKIVLRNDDVKLNDWITDSVYDYMNNPCMILVDSYLFYTYNNSISPALFLQVFAKCAIKNKNFNTYHFNTAKFETTNLQDKGFWIGEVVGKLTLDRKLKSIQINAKDFITSTNPKKLNDK